MYLLVALLLLGVYVFIDASFRRSLESLIRTVVVALAFLATIILFIQFFVRAARVGGIRWYLHFGGERARVDCVDVHAPRGIRTRTDVP